MGDEVSPDEGITDAVAAEMAESLGLAMTEVVGDAAGGHGESIDADPCVHGPSSSWTVCVPRPCLGGRSTESMGEQRWFGLQGHDHGFMTSHHAPTTSVGYMRSDMRWGKV